MIVAEAVAGKILAGARGGGNDDANAGGGKALG